MTSLPSKFRIALLVGLLVAGSGHGQEANETPAPQPEVPDLSALQQTWWTYFEGNKVEVAARIDTFLGAVSDQLADLAPQNEQRARDILDTVRENFEVYLTLLDEASIEAREIAEPAASYTIDELLAIAATARDARAAAATESLAVEREQRILDGATRRRDSLFKEYLDSAAGDERWLTALRLVRARSAQKISERRLGILTRSFENATAYADAAAARVDLAQRRLATTAGAAELDALTAAVDARRADVEKAEKAQREAQVAAASLEIDTAQARSEQRLQQQKVVAADVNLSAAEVALAAAQAELRWTELKLDVDTDLGDIENELLRWSELLRILRQDLPGLKRRTEDELLAVQASSRDGLESASRRLLDQRLGTAQDTLTRISGIEAGVADLALLIAAVDNAIAESSGTIRLWIANASRVAKTAWIRVREVTTGTLFSVGETPVTGGDLLQALLILLVALLMSRGVRYGIRRIGSDESSGTQASLYTIGRLTHYAIIIIAAFVALTSIGLDFSNVALVAGALSVGIGFGLQSMVSNFVSGLIILFERTLRVGDYIELDTGLTGTVKAINVRSTLINTNDNIDIVVPNSEFVTTRLTNWTLGERILRVRIPFGVAYGSDKDLVKKAAMEAADEVQYTLTHMPGREPDIWLVEYGDSSLNFLLLVWVNRQGARRPTRTRAAYLWALHTKLEEYGIEIPFPQRDLHLRSGWQGQPGPKAAADAETDSVPGKQADADLG